MLVLALVHAELGGMYPVAGGSTRHPHFSIGNLATGGIIFSYQGFEQAIQFGGETRNPGRNMPFVVIGSMLVGLVLYIAPQVAFLGALEPSNLSKGWDEITFPGLAGPFAGLATAVGASWLAVLLYIDVAVSPGGTGLLYSALSACLSFALARNH